MNESLTGLFVSEMREMHLKFKLLLFIFTFTLMVSAKDIVEHKGSKTFPTNPTNKLENYEPQIYWDLAHAKENIEWNRLDASLEFIKAEYDCSDFRLVNLIRIIYEFENKIPSDYKSKIENVLVNFRYWLDEPGGNSMCYWSENHQILFASAEYLIGLKYSTTVFPNSGLTGSEHAEKAKKRILDWLSLRWNYGFTEFYSNVYYKEDVNALINLIDYAPDKEIAKKSQIIMDLLFYDIATQSSKTMFISVSGRAYERNRKGGKDANFSGVTQYYWGNGKKLDAGTMYGLMQSTKYELPPVLKEIALDSSNVIIKQSNGLNISELKSEGFAGRDMSSLIMQWGMEAFVNPSVVRNSLAHIRSYNMFSNESLKDFKILNFFLLRLLHLEPFAVRLVNPQFLGTAIQRGNTYTYRTKDYSMSTVQDHQLGEYASQQHVFGLNINNQFAIFHCHPAVEKDVKSQSPNYWVGYGHLPHSVQSKNVNLSIYKIPNCKGIIELDLLKYTHAYFPKEKFDSTFLVDNYLFGRKGNTYCALIGANNFIFRKGSTDDVIQNGKRVFWITEAGSKSEDGTFENFIQRIQHNEIHFNNRNLSLYYYSNKNKYELKYDADFKVNGQVIDTNYRRFDSPYVQAVEKAGSLNIKLNGKSLFLDFENLIREY